MSLLILNNPTFWQNGTDASSNYCFALQLFSGHSRLHKSKRFRPKTNVSTPTAAVPTKPKSKQDSTIPFQTQDLAEAEPLIIEVDSHAEIGGVVRSVFQDTRGVLWIGGEGDLFRNDGKALTSYDIKDDLGTGVTIKRIIEDKEGNIWCGTSGGITRIDGESFTSFGEKRGLISLPNFGRSSKGGQSQTAEDLFRHKPESQDRS